MDWAGWAIFGLIATAVLTAVMVGAQMAGLSRLDVPLMLGTIVIADPDRARIAGFFIHLVNGQAFALGYAAVFAATEDATWWAGGLLGLLHGLGRVGRDRAVAARRAPEHGVGAGRAVGRAGLGAAGPAGSELWASDAGDHVAGSRGVRYRVGPVVRPVVAVFAKRAPPGRVRRG